MTDGKATQVCIVTVTGVDNVGIVAKLATAMARFIERRGRMPSPIVALRN